MNEVVFLKVKNLFMSVRVEVKEDENDDDYVQVCFSFRCLNRNQTQQFDVRVSIKDEDGDDSDLLQFVLSGIRSSHVTRRMERSSFLTLMHSVAFRKALALQANHQLGAKRKRKSPGKSGKSSGGKKEEESVKSEKSENGDGHLTEIKKQKKNPFSSYAADSD